MKSVEDCDLLTLSKADLTKVDAEYEEIIADLFGSATIKLKRTLKIKNDSESYFLKKQLHPNRISNSSQDSLKVRRMSSALGNINNQKSTIDGNPLSNEEGDNITGRSNNL